MSDAPKLVPRCPRCRSENVTRHDQKPPARSYFTCGECGRTGGILEFMPPTQVSAAEETERARRRFVAATVAAMSSSIGGPGLPGDRTHQGPPAAERGKP